MYLTAIANCEKTGNFSPSSQIERWYKCAVIVTKHLILPFKTLSRLPVTICKTKTADSWEFFEKGAEKMVKSEGRVDTDGEAKRQKEETEER